MWSWMPKVRAALMVYFAIYRRMRALSPKPSLIVGQCAALVLHLRGELPGAADHLVDAAHALAVGAEHRDGAESCSTSSAAMVWRADAALGEGHILRDRRI